MTDDLDRRRRERLVRELAQQLRTNQSVTVKAESVGDIEGWRQAARLAGRRVRIPVRTGVSEDGTKVWASEGP